MRRCWMKITQGWHHKCVTSAGTQGSKLRRASHFTAWHLPTLTLNLWSASEFWWDNEAHTKGLEPQLTSGSVFTSLLPLDRSSATYSLPPCVLALPDLPLHTLLCVPTPLSSTFSGSLGTEVGRVGARCVLHGISGWGKVITFLFLGCQAQKPSPGVSCPSRIQELSMSQRKGCRLRIVCPLWAEAEACGKEDWLPCPLPGSLCTGPTNYVTKTD